MQCDSVSSSLTPSQRHMSTQTPDTAFYDSFQDAFEQFDKQVGNGSSAASSPNSISAPNVSLSDLLGDTQCEMAKLWKVSDADERQYAAILDKAYQQDAMKDPKKFLQSLSQSDLAIVQHMHDLADPINVGNLSNEGASNLLLPEGYSVDLNHDGFEEVGAAKVAHFPPRDAPAAFANAWFQATKGLDGSDYALHAMTFLVGLHPPTESGDVGTGLPSDQLNSYKKIVDNYLSMLNHYSSFLAPGQYERDQPFFSRLQNLLQNAPG